ncbi:MAG: hypothetical protein GXP31_12545 [Kiritimatiellaeota bacterium]|nr:hypothetical protein [Kiritimatiellota bacterium]
MKRIRCRLSTGTFPSFAALAVAVTLSGAPAAPAPTAVHRPPPTPRGRRSVGSTRDIFADTWVAADALGRVLPGAETCGPPRPGKIVAMFYWTWHLPKINPGVRGDVYDNSRIIGEALAEGTPPRWPRVRANHFWGEPELGYYRTTDSFVLRKHASMLADAGVDVIVFDTTNPPFTWKEGYLALCREFSAMRKAGNRTPSIAFMCPFGDPTVVVERVFDELYRPGLYADLWFRWEGKPLILANPKYFRKKREIREFFTFRAPIPGYWTRPSGPGQWPWLQVYPQHGFPDATGHIECVAVGVAQNAIPGYFGPAPMSHKKGAMGRSWHDLARDPNAEAVLYGPNFREQWGRALELDPQVVFVTGWNEWTASRLPKFGPFNEHDDAVYPGGLFIDEYNEEYSRDIEPMKGGFGDSYYYQLVAWVRMFKGVRSRALPKGPAAIRIDGRFDDWTAVRPEFRDTVGDTLHRREPGYDGRVYVNDTGRNDIVRCKAAYDAESVFFFVETRRALTPVSDRNWMLLFVDADQDPATGWNGYDFLIDASRSGSTQRASVVRPSDSTTWQEAGGAEFRVAGNRLELRISRSVLGLDGVEPPAFDFHWADNIQRIAIDEFGVNGDSAPNRRFNYRFGPDPAPSKERRRPIGYFPRDLRRGKSGRVVLPPPSLQGLPQAWWVWRRGGPDAMAAAPGETTRFRRRLTVAELGKGDGAFMAAAVDDSAEVFVNKASCGVLTGWTPPAVFPIVLQAGENLIEIVVKNAGDAPNPAGLAAEIALRKSDGSVKILARTGDGKWEAALDKAGTVREWARPRRIGRVGCEPWGSLP